jgi:hydroxymethylglutaryl-CoA lyase
MSTAAQLVECPRDAMQGMHDFIPTELKIRYLNLLLRVGFDVLDFGSFVSPKAIPQMADTAQVLEKLDLTDSQTKLLAIVANLRGAEQAVSHPQITFLGFPLSASETFQQRNTRKSIPETLTEIAEIQELCVKHSKNLVVYISMGFGNPYGDVYHPDLVAELTGKLQQLNISIISLADTTGSADAREIENLYKFIVPKFPEMAFGVHLHTLPQTASAKLEAAYQAGCRRFDGAIRGFGGCPMASDTLTGNMPTEVIVEFLAGKDEKTQIHPAVFAEALRLSEEIWGK